MPDPGCSCKELSRPTPWPELDTVETAYEDQLKTDWTTVRDKVFTIMKLEPSVVSASSPVIPASSSVVPAPSSVVPAKAGTQSLTKDDLPDPLAAFTFTDEQRAAVMKAMKDFTGTYTIDDPASPVRWYYGQSYSLGLIQAARLVGQERPILDIIKNAEVYDTLCETGFQLLKDNATRAIVNKIMPEMQAQMLAGTNPRHVAARLNDIFGAQNSDWERLARTEMNMSAERAKLDEWKEWEVEQVEFLPAPDGCPICFALAGTYDIGQCPIPGQDTHPRCRCSTRPTEREA
jgi:SPP1 gp7 family putative phage head morphogenesis protein